MVRRLPFQTMHDARTRITAAVIIEIPGDFLKTSLSAPNRVLLLADKRALIIRL
jgi:hypothetical protein